MGLIAILLITAVLLAYFWIKKKLNYWTERGLETSSSSAIKVAKEMALSEKSFTGRTLEYYKEFKSKNLRHGGTYFLLDPFYFPIDLDIIKSIMQVDFQHFVDRSIYINEKVDPLSAHLVAMKGNKWKILRAKLSPTFTAGKMKMIFETLLKCTDGLFKVMEKEEGNILDIKDITSRFTIDVLGNCTLGLDCNTLENPDSEFRRLGVAAFDRNFLESLRFFLTFAAPKLMKMLNVGFYSKEIRDFFMGMIKQTVDYREQNNVSRKDFLDLLLQLKNRGKLVDDEKLEEQQLSDEDNKFTFEVLAAQVFIFFEAGFETASTAMAYCLYELAKNKQIQDKAREHVRHVLAKNGGKFGYETMSDMNYLEQIINESLRKYPPIPIIPRECTKEYKVPGTDIIIEKGIKVSIPVVGIHHDPEYYPDPDKFDPERFTEENIQARPPFTFLPFGEGPRICIGLRFGVMQMKVGLTALLLNYEFTVNKKTKEPIEYEPKNIISSVKGGLWLDFKKVNPKTVTFSSEN